MVGDPCSPKNASREFFSLASTYAGDDVASPGMHIGNFACMYEIASGFLVDKNRQYGQVLVESDGVGTTLASYVHANDLVSMDRAGVESFYLVDGQLSTRALTDGAGVVSDTYMYEAFGNEVSGSGSSVNSYRYTGEQWERDVSAYYLRARFYLPSQGRFISTDPVLCGNCNPASRISNLYAYTDGNPLIFVDPSGRELFSIDQISAVSEILGVLNDIARPEIKYENKPTRCQNITVKKQPISRRAFGHMWFVVNGVSFGFNPAFYLPDDMFGCVDGAIKSPDPAEGHEEYGVTAYQPEVEEDARRRGVTCGGAAAVLRHVATWYDRLEWCFPWRTCTTFVNEAMSRAHLRIEH